MFFIVGILTCECSPNDCQQGISNFDIKWSDEKVKHYVSHSLLPIKQLCLQREEFEIEVIYLKKKSKFPPKFEKNSGILISIKVIMIENLIF